MYDKLSGMTGTAMTEEAEFERNIQLRCYINTNKQANDKTRLK